LLSHPLIRRKGNVTEEAWAKTWTDVDLRVEELQKKLTVFPPPRLVEKWLAGGKFKPQGDAKHGSALPPWAQGHRDQLRDDGAGIVCGIAKHLYAWGYPLLY
jgi:hypothetical protein